MQQVIIKFVLKHKGVFIFLGAAFIVFLIWQAYVELQSAKELGKAIGKGITAPFRAVAGFIDSLFNSTPEPPNPALAPLDFTFGPGQDELGYNLPSSSKGYSKLGGPQIPGETAFGPIWVKNQ